MTFSGSGGEQFGYEMGAWMVRTRSEPVGQTAQLADVLTMNDVRTEFEFSPAPDAILTWIVTSHLRFFDPFPWLTFGAAVVARPLLDGVRVISDGAKTTVGLNTIGGVLHANPKWLTPDLHALAAAHFAAVLRGDSLLHVLADWFADRDIGDMEKVCREMAKQVTPAVEPG